MSFKDRVQKDIGRVFLNPRHFGETHTWNGLPFLCVPDEENALKRKNNNVVDLSWDNNTGQVLIYVQKGDFPGRLVPNEHGFFDRKAMKIMSIQEDVGVVAVLLASNDPKPIGTGDDFSLGGVVYQDG